VSWTRVQGTGAARTSSGTTLSATLSGVAAGNLLVLGVDAEAAGGTPTLTISDGTNSYNLAHDTTTAYSDATIRLAVYSALAAAGSFTVTVISSLSGLITISFDEFVAAGTTPAVDVVDDASDSADGDQSGSVTLSPNAADLVVGVFDIRSTNLSYTAASGYTKGYTQNGINSRPYAMAYSLSAGPGSTSPGVSWGLLNTQWTGVAAAWRSDTIATAWPFSRQAANRPVGLSLLNQLGRLY
jgi:hypothetical protein